MVIVIDVGARARMGFDRRRHAALELIVVIRIQEIMLAVVLIVHHRLNRC